MKTAFLFSGQGAQYVGMGKELYETYESSRAVFDQAECDFDLRRLCFEGPQEQLNDTRYAQACIFIMSMAAAAALREHGICADVCAGLSLGEYSALCYGESFSVTDGVHIVGERGKLMAQALPAGTSSMAAVLMLDEASILKACKEVRDIGICEIANYNCPGQIVITGDAAAVAAARGKCLDYGARKVIPLPVSGAFHSSLLNDASKQLRQVLNRYELKKPVLPIYHNLTGKREAAPLIDLLSEQIAHSVYFEQTIANMLADGVTTFIEVGPGSAVSGFVKKCTKGTDVTILHVEDKASLETVIRTWKG